MNKCNRIQLAKNTINNNYGYQSCSDDDSDDDSKTEFDEIYARSKPPLIPIEPTKHKIIEIGPEDEEECVPTEHMSYSSVLKKNLKHTENKACTGLTLVKGEENKKRNSEEKTNAIYKEFPADINVIHIKNENKNLLNNNMNQNEVITLEIVSKTVETPDDEFRRHPEVFPENIPEDLKNKKTVPSIVENSQQNVKTSKRRRRRQKKTPKDATETKNSKPECNSNAIFDDFDKIPEINCHLQDDLNPSEGKNQKSNGTKNYIKTLNLSNTLNIKDTTKIIKVNVKDQNRHISKNRKRKKTKKTKSYSPSEGCILSMFDNMTLYQNNFAYQNPNFFTFKKNFFDGPQMF